MSAVEDAQIYADLVELCPMSEVASGFLERRGYPAEAIRRFRLGWAANPGQIFETLDKRHGKEALGAAGLLDKRKEVLSGWLYYGGNYNPNNPSFVGTANTVDPDIKNDRTREFIVGLDHELFSGFAVGATYIWRKYDQFRWDDRVGFGSSDYVARTFTPAASACPNAGSRCDTVTYYEPTRSIPSLRVRFQLSSFSPSTSV